VKAWEVQFPATYESFLAKITQKFSHASRVIPVLFVKGLYASTSTK
jgi:hypothetical protein